MALRRRQHARRRPVGGTMPGDVSLEIHSKAAAVPITGHAPAVGRDCATSRRVRRRACSARAAGRRGRRALAPDGARRPADGSAPVTGRPPVRQPHACPSRLARHSRQRRRSPPRSWLYPAMATPATSCTDSVGVARGAGTGPGSGGARARPMAGAWRGWAGPSRRCTGSGGSRAAGRDVGSGLSTRVTRATAGAPLSGLRVRHACAHAHRRAAGPCRERSAQRQHTRGGRHMSIRTHHTQERG